MSVRQQDGFDVERAQKILNNRWEEVLRRAHNLDIPQDERPQIVFLQGQEIPTSSIDFNAMLQNALAEKQNLKE